MESKKQPAQKFRAGAVTLTVWPNTAKVKGSDVIFYSYDLSRSYKDKDGNWQNTHSLKDADLPKAQYLLSKAYEWRILGVKPDEETEQA